MEADTFISKIRVIQSRNIRDLTIELSETVRKHLIITGRNGSGKTSLLTDLNSFLSQIEIGLYPNYQDYISKLEDKAETKKEIEQLELKLQNLQTQLQEIPEQQPFPPPTDLDSHSEFRRIQNLRRNLNQSIQNTTATIYQLKNSIDENGQQFAPFGGIRIDFANGNLITEKYNKGQFLFSFFEDIRATSLTVPQGIQKQEFKDKYSINQKINRGFLQYIVNLVAERSFARDEGDVVTVDNINSWFVRFENLLKHFFSSPELKLKFDRANFNFDIIEPNKQPYNFNTLSRGYSAIFNIVTELILRMENLKNKVYDLEGVVLIDEIETHLHVDLQKNILPFLTDFFPKIQFIVTTHSPFVLSSISNAVICDLEKEIVTEDLSGYSYDTLIESYFDSDKYSNRLKSYVAEYKTLVDMENLSEDKKSRLFELKTYLNEIPKFMADELAVELQQIKLKEMNKRRKNDLPT
jgi:AAA15 family ATPase/GTPase